jgi:hypothetical protein
MARVQQLAHDGLFGSSNKVIGNANLLSVWLVSKENNTLFTHDGLFYLHLY